MVSYYFNAVDRLSEAGAFYPDTSSRHTMGLSFNGPYVGIQVKV